MPKHFDWQNELSTEERDQIKRSVREYANQRKHDAPADLDSLYEHVLAGFECNDEQLHTDHHTAIREAVSHYAGESEN